MYSVNQNPLVKFDLESVDIWRKIKKAIYIRLHRASLNRGPKDNHLLSLWQKYCLSIQLIAQEKTRKQTLNLEDFNTKLFSQVKNELVCVMQ